MSARAASLLLFACLLGAPAMARAGEIYKYVEPDGTVLYTNVPQAGRKGKRVTGNVKTATRREPVAPPRAVKVTRDEYDGYIRNAARRYRIPEALVWAVMHAESAFNRYAESPVGAQGLMQLMPATASEMYVQDPFDVRDNIEGGTRYLRVLANMFDGDMVKMVAAYNAGPDAVRKHRGKVPPYAETQDYVRKVVALYFQYKKSHPRADEEPAPPDEGGGVLADALDGHDTDARFTGAE
jgi:soluble lytic murein transglycosylase-like protein